ncbi:MAG: DUF2764 family protein [Bacteroidales bacterium]|mgnify:CR=1 FL=1|jgi:hypothetical protein|nr:DUF2764 family protein [Bacteroidales bacterium]
MNNYEYIIASLPVLRLDDLKAGRGLAEKLLGEIRSQLSERDNALLDFLLLSYDPDQLNADFYKRALAHRNRYVREWFAFDLDLRNATVDYLNESLGREKGQDQILLEGREEAEFPERAKAETVLHGDDILDRERGLDELRWQKIDEINLMEYFNMEVILGFICKLKIIDRWLQLDPESGRAMFRKLVEDIRSTYDNKKQNITI